MCKHTKCPKLVSYFTHSRTGHSQKNIFHGLLNKISLILSDFVSFSCNNFTFFSIFVVIFEGNEYVYKLFLEVLASDDSLINWDELLSKEPHNIVDLIAAKFIFVFLVHFLVLFVLKLINCILFCCYVETDSEKLHQSVPLTITILDNWNYSIWSNWWKPSSNRDNNVTVVHCYKQKNFFFQYSVRTLSPSLT